jgi:hypothetical protein
MVGFFWCAVWLVSADDLTYPARYVADASIKIDGIATDPGWSRAVAEQRFTFPWKATPAPPTTFRALCGRDDLFFLFQVEDSDIVVLDKLRDEEDAVFEDRVEVYFARDNQLKRYFCVEIDSRGRMFDYSGSFYRQLDPKWNWPGLEVQATTHEKGYVVEGRIPLANLEAIGLPRLRPGVRIRWGLYRAEFSHDRSGRPVEQRETIHNRGRKLDGPPPIEEWISWVDPRTREPDFHVPSALGWLEVVE